jgi:HEAT repeat protein
MSMPTTVAERVTVPFRLDPALGPNHVHVLLVMCEFTIPLHGSFTLDVGGNRLQIADIDIHGGAFPLAFAPDFVMNVLDVHITRDNVDDPQGGTVAGPIDDGEFALECDVPLRVNLRIDVNGAVEDAVFEARLAMTGGISGSTVTLRGEFTFQLEHYDDAAMKPKFGACRVLLSASSELQFEIAGAAAALTFAGASRDVALSGRFVVGLDGLEVHVLGLALTATPYQVPGLFEVGEIVIALDDEVPRLPVRFDRIADAGYQVRGAIPCRLRAELTLLGFSSQPLSSLMTVYVRGRIALNASATISISDRVEVNIGDGAVYLDVRAEIDAIPSLISARTDPDSTQRRLVTQIANETSLDRLQWALGHPEIAVRWQAVHALAKLLPESVSLLLRALDDPSPDVQIAALRALRGADGGPAAPRILGHFEHSAALLRLESLLTLAALPGDTWRAACASALRDPDPVLRSQAAGVVGQRADPAETAAMLAPALGDADPFVRLCAAAAIIGQDASHQAAADAICNLLESERDMCIQMVGCIGLAESTSKRAPTVVRRLLATTGDPFVRHAARFTDGKFGGVAP